LTSIGLALAVLAVAGCGGGGGGGGSSGPPGSKLFISDGGNHALVSIINAAPTVNSTFTIDRVVAGSATGLGSGVGSTFSIPSIALDAVADRLYVATQGNTFIFDGISQANGNVAPTRTMSATINTGSGNRGVNFFHISLDAVNSRLYSVDSFGEVHVFNNPTTPAGATTVTRIINPDLGPTTILSTFGLAIDAGKNMLYLGAVFSGSGSSNIIVFDNADTAGTAPTTITPLAPNRTLSFAQGVGSFFLDTLNDRLYVSQSNGVVLVFDGASLLASGTSTPSRTIDMLNAVQNYIFVERNRNKLYAVANDPVVANNRAVLNIIDNASTADEPNVSGLSVFVTATNIELSAVAVAP
jgi:hypothetical protein